MKNPWFIKIPFPQNPAFDIVKVSRPYFVVPWHFHPEIELMFLTSGSGTRFVGDSIESFDANELVLVGANLAHVWKSGEEHFRRKASTLAGALYIVIKETALKNLLLYGEMEPVRELFARARRGIKFGPAITGVVGEMMTASYQQTGPEQFILFLSILKTLAETDDYRYLCSAGYRQKVDAYDMSKLDSVLDYLMINYKNEVRLTEVADIANMSLTAFCRYFKERPNKTVMQFLNEIRIEHAQRMLIESDYNVEKISTECGFKNITNFYQQFQKLAGSTPLNFRKKNLTGIY